MRGETLLCGKHFVVKHAGVGRFGEEVLALWGLDEFAHQECGVLVGFVARGWMRLAGSRELFVDVRVAECSGDWAAVFEDRVMMHPLPKLCAADLRRGGILHQIEERNAAYPSQPCFDVAQADGDVLLE